MTRRVPLAAPALALAVLALGAPAASGHAAFVGATPPPGGRVETAPQRIVLRFSEPLNRELTEATLRAADGRRIEARQGIRGRRIVLVAGRALDRGAYRVEWRTVSTDDAHPLEGSYGFGVRAAAGAGSQAVEQSPLAGGGWARALSRGLLYAALLLFAGALLVRALLGSDWPVPRRSPSPPAGPIAPRPSPGGGVATLAPPRAQVQAGPLPGAEAAIARADALVLDAGLATAGLAALSAIVDASVAAGGFSVAALDDYLLASQPGVARIALVGIALVAVALAGRAPRVAAVAGLAALGCVVASGHANSADPRGLAILADWAHLAGGAVWLGGAGLIALAWGPGLRDGATRSAVMRDVLPVFGRVALPAFALVVGAGIVNAVVELGSVRALWDSSYGLVLLAKIALVAGAAGAAFVHVRLRARAAGDPSGERRGWRALRMEVALGAGVVAAAGLLVAFPLPPRQLDAATEGLAATPACDPCPLPAPRADELAVADQAGGLVVAAWIRREPRRLTGTIRTLDFRGRPARGPIRVPGGRTRPCGTGCATFTLAGAPPTLRATVADRGRVYPARLPARWQAGASARARRALNRAERTMRALRSVREDELVTSGPGTRAVTRYALRAPDRLAYATDRGVRTVQIGRRQWLRSPGEQWTVAPIPGGISFRTRTWFRWTPYARTVELLGERRGVAELASADPATPVWFRLSVDERTGRVLREELVARARLIRHRFFGFNGGVTIVPPKDAIRAGEAPASPAEHGTLRWIGRGAAIIAAAAFLGLLAYGLTAKSDNKTIDDALARSKATPAPNFTLDVLQRGRGGDAKLARAMADGRLSLRELRGSPVVLNFWASWCIPCRDEAADLQLTWNIERADGAIVLGLDQQDITSDARGFIRDFGLTYPMVRDGGDDTAHRYGNTGIPETYFISARGDVVGHVIGAVSSNALSYGLQAARAGEPNPAKAGGPRKKT